MTGANENVKGAVVLLSVDNLSVHSRFGFKESSSQNCICRIFYATIAKSQKCFRENEFRRRNPTDHVIDAENSLNDSDNMKSTIRKTCMCFEQSRAVS